MNAPATQLHVDDPVSPQLRQQWADGRMVPLWESTNGALGTGGPLETAQIWRWAETRPVLLETAKIVTPSIVERRVLQLANPGVGDGGDSSTGLMNATLQAMMPGEVARPHRHTMNALRFILEGDGAETIVDGKPCVMHPGDLITTPAMTWHEHVNRTPVPALWLDVLDVNLLRHIGMARFFPGPVTGDAARTVADAAFGSSSIVPAGLDATAFAHSPVFRYPWADVLKALAAAPAEHDGSKHVRYVNPLTGAPCMSLIDCFAVELPAAGRTVSLRTTASAVCTVVEGEGVSSIGESRVTWAPKDTFTIPQHSWYHHEATRGPARLFIASNREVYRRLAMLVEESDPAAAH